MCFICVSRVFQGWYKGVLSVFQDSLIGVMKVNQGCLKGFSSVQSVFCFVIHEKFMAVSSCQE